MRILIIANALDNQNTGIHYYLRDMVNALAAGANQHQYILVRDRKDPRLNLQQIALWNIRLPIISTIWRLFFILPILIPYLAVRLRVDAVLEPTHFGPFNLPRRIKRINIVHDLTAIKFPAFHRWHSHILQSSFLKATLRRADLIITNSRHTSSDVVAFDSSLQRKTHCIYPAVTFSSPATASVPQRFQLQGEYLLVIGTIEPRKNLIRLLNAYEAFRRDTAKQLKLVIAGGIGWKHDAFLKVLEGNAYRSDILITGYVSDAEKAQLLANCLFFIYPSLYEGFGLPVLEAMHYGKAMIVSQTSSLPEVAGNCALYVNPESETDIAEKIARLSADEALRKSLEANCAAQADKFGWDKFAVEFEHLVSQM
jgi:glycosyltransferase involved in cell wall biosynthesis